MRLDVAAATLIEGSVYELWLTRAGKREVQCGSFLARPGKVSVPLNAPYKLRDYDGWIIVPHGSRTTDPLDAGRGRLTRDRADSRDLAAGSYPHRA